MNPIDRRLQLDLVTARYLEALEQDNAAAMKEIWRAAMKDNELEGALQDIHAGLIEEQVVEEATAVRAGVTSAVETHLRSAEIIRTATYPVTVAEVAQELFHKTPSGLPAGAHQLNEHLLHSQEPLPEDLGLSKLTAWAEGRFGTAPAEYWRSFRKAAVKLELRRAAEIECRMAARRASK